MAKPNRLDVRETDDSWSLGRIGREKEEVAESAGKGAVDVSMEGIKDKITPGSRKDG